MPQANFIAALRLGLHIFVEESVSATFNIETILKNIGEIADLGFVFNGKFSLKHGRDRVELVYGIRSKCGHTTYCRIHNIRERKNDVCGECARSLSTGRRGGTVIKYSKEHYEKYATKGTEILALESRKESFESGKKQFTYLKIKCTCGAVFWKRAGNLKCRGDSSLCMRCRNYKQYGDYASVKMLSNNLKGGIEDVRKK
jgi:hypothetical protein